MTSVIEARGLTKRFGSVTAVNSATFSIEANTITGLLGRNGAGKTTLMQLMTAQQFASDGTISVFGSSPVENATTLQQVCFIKESQKYPDDYQPRHIFRAAPWFYPNWDADFAERLIAEFRVPVTRRMKKLSRGQVSAVGVIVGLASRAPITFFDEPYLGLDAVARQVFYDRLLEDYAEHPRTVVLSTHLIDEVSNLLERVLVIDDGRIIVDKDAEELRGQATTLAGPAAAVERFVAGRDVLHTERLGGLATATVGALGAADRAAAAEAGLELAPVSLQQLIIRLTTQGETSTAGLAAESEKSA
jgi:ABC-2 type transport system ATP-binding protein